MNTVAELDELNAAAIRHRTPCGEGWLTWREWGGGPPLVLLHGGFGSWRHWARNIPALSGRFRVLAPDLPGMGDSDPAPGQPDIPALVGLLSRGLDSLLGVPRRYDMAGFSFGALMAGALAAQEPTRVRSLVLTAPVSLSAGRPRPPATGFRRLAGEERRDAHRANLLSLMFSDPSHVDELALHIQEVNNALVRFTGLNLAMTDGLRTALPVISPRPVMLWGERDNLSLGYMEENLSIVRAVRPDATVSLVAGAGHWLPYEEPGVVNAAILAAAHRRDGEV